jgi:hypothetical protein
MNRHLIAEGATDLAILQEVLRPELEANHLRLWAAGGKSAADSMARTVLAVRREPVVLLVDSDGRPREEEERYYEASLGEAAPREMWRVCLADPSIEICFFDPPESVTGLFGVTLSDADGVLARFRPRQVLDRLLSQQGVPSTPEGIRAFLAGKDLSVLRESELIKRIRRALDEVREHAVEVV